MDSVDPDIDAIVKECAKCKFADGAGVLDVYLLAKIKRRIVATHVVDFRRDVDSETKADRRNAVLNPLAVVKVDLPPRLRIV